jgi:mannose-6-phosphate isomerase-like protein (cupin superfamily)
VIRKGDIIENPVTGERLLFRQTAADTNGEVSEVECWVRPDGAVAAAHVHPQQTEVFRILGGTVAFRLGRETVTARAGDVVTVEPGTPHKFWNAGLGEAHFVTEVRPALQFESLIETMYGLAEDGKTNRKGMPNPLRLAVIARAHFNTVRLPFPPAWMQRAGLALGAPMGRLLGYAPAYTGATETPLPAAA